MKNLVRVLIHQVQLTQRKMNKHLLQIPSLTGSHLEQCALGEGWCACSFSGASLFPLGPEVFPHA